MTQHRQAQNFQQIREDNEELQKIVSQLLDRKYQTPNSTEFDKRTVGNTITYESQAHNLPGMVIQPRYGSVGERIRDDAASKVVRYDTAETKSVNHPPVKSALKIIPKHSGSDINTGNSEHNRNINQTQSYERGNSFSKIERDKTDRSYSSKSKPRSRKSSDSPSSDKFKRRKSKSKPETPNSSSKKEVKKRSKSKHDSSEKKKKSAGKVKQAAQQQDPSTERAQLSSKKTSLINNRKDNRELLLYELSKFKKPVLPRKTRTGASLSTDKIDKSTGSKNKVKKKPTLDENFNSIQSRKPTEAANKSISTRNRGSSISKPLPNKLLVSSVRSRDKDAIMFSNNTSLMPSKMGSLASEGLQTKKRKSIAASKVHK